MDFRRRAFIELRILRHVIESCHVCGWVWPVQSNGLPVPVVAVDKADTGDSCVVSWKYRTTSVKQLVHVVSVVGLKFRQNVNSSMR